MKVFSSQIHREFTEHIMNVLSNRFSEKKLTAVLLANSSHHFQFLIG